MNNELLERVAKVIWESRYSIDDDSLTIARKILAELAGELEDKARLDWMAKQKSISVHCRKGRFAINSSINYEYELKPLREAIDEARGWQFWV